MTPLQLVKTQVEAALKTGSWTAAQLHTTYKISPPTLRKWIKLDGWPSPLALRKPKGPGRPPEWAWEAWANRERAEDIALRAGVHVATVRKWARLRGWKRKAKPRVIKTPLQKEKTNAPQTPDATTQGAG